MIDFTWMTGGKQGSGIDAALEMFSRMIIGYGYETYGYREYFSNIKGMHSFFIVRVADKKIHSIDSQVDIAVFSDRESVFGEKNLHGETIHEGHLKDIKPGGMLIIDKNIDASKIYRKDIKLISLDFDGIIKNASNELNVPLVSLEITKNVIAVVSSAYLLGIDEDEILSSIKSTFKNKPESVVSSNFTVAKRTLDAMRNQNKTMQLQKRENSNIYIEGTYATAIGKAIGGCKLQVYYPITPASDESTFLEAHPELGIRVVQPESELAVVGIVAGASIAGIRAATSTSGPGFALMTETVSFAGMTETPLVIVDHQRGGPATGLPTRTEQGDLSFALNQGHGHFSRVVLAPGTTEQMIEMTAEAFNYAEKYQLPVIVLGDKALAQASVSLDEGFITALQSDYRIDRGKLVSHDPQKGEYKRYSFTDDGISPRTPLGDPNAITYVAGDEHDEYGHVLEEPNNRIKMEEKRAMKDDLILKETSDEKKYELHNDPKTSDLLVVTWGSSTGPILDALDPSISLLQLKMLMPFPKDVVEILKSAKKTVVVEQSIGADLKKLIASQTGFVIENEILKYNGRPIREDEIAEALSKIKNGENRVILNGY